MGEWWERQRITVAVALAAAMVGAGLALLLVRPEPPPVRVIQPTSVPTPSEVVVHVGGAVAAAGVYQLPATARVSDALEAAGGATAGGNPQALNLAARLRDGQRIVVPEHGERVGPGQADRAAGVDVEPRKIDLNRADEAQLDALPGIGPVTARRIVEHRERFGPFERVEQLQEARLVNRTTYEQIKDLVTVQ